MSVPAPEPPPMRVVGWMLVVTGDVLGVPVKFHHGLWTGPEAKARAERAAERWQAALIRGGRHYAVTAAPLFGKGTADRDGTWATAEAAVGKVRNTTHVEKESP